MRRIKCFVYYIWLFLAIVIGKMVCWVVGMGAGALHNRGTGGICVCTLEPYKLPIPKWFHLFFVMFDNFFLLYPQKVIDRIRSAGRTFVYESIDPIESNRMESYWKYTHIWNNTFCTLLLLLVGLFYSFWLRFVPSIMGIMTITTTSSTTTTATKTTTTTMMLIENV